MRWYVHFCSTYLYTNKNNGLNSLENPYWSDTRNMPKHSSETFTGAITIATREAMRLFPFFLPSPILEILTFPSPPPSFTRDPAPTQDTLINNPMGQGLKSWKKFKLVPPLDFISKLIAVPAGQANWVIVYEFPGLTVVTP